MRTIAAILMAVWFAGAVAAQTNALNPAPYTVPAPQITTPPKPAIVKPFSPYDPPPTKTSKKAKGGFPTARPAAVFAPRVFHVADGGSDQNDGSQAKPFRSIQKAADAAVAGDTVAVQAGVYAGFAARNAGAPDRPIVFRARGDALIESGKVLVHKTGWVFIEGFIVHGGIDLLDSHDIVIQNNLLPRGGGIHLGGDASRRNLVANNTVIEPRAAPIRLTGRASHNVLFNNLLVGPRSIADESGQNSVDARSNLRRTSADGLFAAAGDFHLARKSPAIHAGRADCDGRCAPGHDIEGIRRFARLPCAGAYDIGPFEPPPGRLDK